MHDLLLIGVRGLNANAAAAVADAAVDVGFDLYF
jgi:hypothetical protein